MHNPPVKKSVRKTIIGSSLIAALAIFLILEGFFYFHDRSQLHQQASNHLRILLSNQVAELNKANGARQKVLDGLAKQANWIALAGQSVSHPNDPSNLQTLVNLLRTSLDQNGQGLFDQLVLLAPDGHIVASTQAGWEGKQFGAVNPLQDHSNSARVILVPYAAPLLPNQWVIATIQPVLKNGTAIAALAGITSLEVPQLTHAVIGLYPGSDLYFAAQGYFTRLNPNGQPGAAQALTSQARPEINRLMNASTQPAVIEFSSTNQGAVLSAGQSIPGLNAGIIIEYPVRWLEAPLLNSFLWSLVLLPVIALLATGIAWLVSARVTWPWHIILTSLQQFLAGDREKRITLQRDDESGQLANLFNHIADDLSTVYTETDHRLIEKTHHFQKASQIIQTIASIETIDTLFSTTCNLIVEQFNRYNASIYLLDESKKVLFLAHRSGPVADGVWWKNNRLAVNANSLIGWTASANQARIIQTVNPYPFANPDFLLPEIQSEAALPIAYGGQIIGVLHSQSDQPGAFDDDTMEALAIIAAQLANTYRHHQNLQATEDTLQEITLLSEASRQIIHARNETEIYQTTSLALRHVSYLSAVLAVKYDRLHFVSIYNPATHEQPDLGQWKSIKTEGILPYLPPGKSYFIQELNKAPAPFTEMVLPLRTIGGQSAVMIPVYSSTLLAGLIILATQDRSTLEAARLQPYLALGEIIGQMIASLRQIQQADDLKNSLNASAAIGMIAGPAMSLQQVYSTTYTQILNLMGDVSFMIALYHPDSATIDFPFVMENQIPIQLDPIPLGEGLTSRLIKEQKAILLVDNVEDEAKALGAKTVGQPARSWLGVPLVLDDQVTGAIIVQDIIQERRFSARDIEILNFLGHQIAVSIRIAQAVETLGKSSQRLQTAAVIAREISTDFQLKTLLKHSVSLVQERFGLYHVAIYLFDPANEYLVLRESAGEASEQLKLDGFKYPQGSQSPVGRAAMTGLTVVASLGRQDASDSPHPLLPLTRSEAAIPIRSGDRLFGVLDVQSNQVDAFSDEDIHVLTLLADQLTIAVLNTQLVEQHQQQVEREKRLSDITNRLHQAEDIPSILKISATEVGKIVNARKATLEITPISSQEDPSPGPDNGQG